MAEILTAANVILSTMTCAPVFARHLPRSCILGALISVALERSWSITLYKSFSHTLSRKPVHQKLEPGLPLLGHILASLATYSFQPNAKQSYFSGNITEVNRVRRWDLMVNKLSLDQRTQSWKNNHYFPTFFLLFPSKLKWLSNHPNATEIDERWDCIVYLYTVQEIS